jgi:lysophospholipase L1-like esterase
METLQGGQISGVAKYRDIWFSIDVQTKKPTRAMHKTLSLVLIVNILLALPALGQPKLDRFEQTIQQFELEDDSTGYRSEAVLFTGSSSIRMWHHLADDMAPLPVLNRGFGGSTLPEVLHYAARIILPHQPETIVLYAGENDLTEPGIKAKDVVKRFKAFAQLVQEKLPDTQVFYLSIKPSVARWHLWPEMAKANKKLQRWMNNRDQFTYVDVASTMLDQTGNVKEDIFIADHLHMNEKGYALWQAKLKPLLVEHMNKVPAEHP